MNCFGGLSNRFATEGSPIYLSNLGSKFSRTKRFCFENWIFYSHSTYAYVRESVRTWDLGLGM